MRSEESPAIPDMFCSKLTRPCRVGQLIYPELQLSNKEFGGICFWSSFTPDRPRFVLKCRLRWCGNRTRAPNQITGQSKVRGEHSARFHKGQEKIRFINCHLYLLALKAFSLRAWGRWAGRAGRGRGLRPESTAMYFSCVILETQGQHWIPQLASSWPPRIGDTLHFLPSNKRLLIPTRVTTF